MCTYVEPQLRQMATQAVMPILPRLFKNEVHFHHVLQHRELLHAYLKTVMAR